MKTNHNSTDSIAEPSTKESVMIFGCGYVGSALASRLLEHGYKVGALTRNALIVEQLQAIGVHEVIQADLDSDLWHQQTNLSYSRVVNCVSSAGGGLAGYEKSYINGQRSILKWAKDYPIERYMYTSSTSVYPQDGGVIVDETASTKEASPTGQCLIRSEALLEARGDLFDRWYVLRLAGIYGPGRQYLLDQAKRIADGPVPGRGDYTMNMIHRDDIVQVILRALESDCRATSGIYNVADDNPVQKIEALSWMAKKLGLPAPEFDTESVSPRLKRRGGHMPDRVVANGKAKVEFGWQPLYPSFKDGMRLNA